MAIERPDPLPPLKGVEDAGVPGMVEMPFYFVILGNASLPIEISPIAPKIPETQPNVDSPWTIRSNPAGSTERTD